MNNSVLTENAYDYILNQILTGEIKPGERIREDIIAEQLGTSRTPVREAVNQLTQNGFIMYIKRKGLYCMEISQTDLLDLIDLRMVLEEFSYQRCAVLASQKDVNSLYSFIDEFNSFSKEKKIENHNQFDIQFHLATAEITNFPRLVKYINEVETILLIARSTLKNSSKISSIIEESWLLHRDIVRGIETKDTSLISLTNQKHIQLMKDTQILNKQ